MIHFKEDKNSIHVLVSGHQELGLPSSILLAPLEEVDDSIDALWILYQNIKDFIHDPPHSKAVFRHV
jgi:hypothetical protein